MIFLDITMIGIDIYLFIYFIKSAMATSTMSFKNYAMFSGHI